MTYFMDNVYVKLAIFSSIYVTILIFVSPGIDHLFTSLEQDKEKKETNTQILVEVILHVVVLVIAWYALNLFLRRFLKRTLNIGLGERSKIALGFISSIALIGLQTNLLNKLEYITITHPFRLAEISSESKNTSGVSGSTHRHISARSSASFRDALVLTQMD